MAVSTFQNRGRCHRSRSSADRTEWHIEPTAIELMGRTEYVGGIPSPPVKRLAALIRRGWEEAALSLMMARIATHNIGCCGSIGLYAATSREVGLGM